ncbi:uncharacterized protein TNCV_1489371 [Trichonephila clavipes]|nr:uncharacterized protein TNCV_1489371 [Trichonephila clavipes]
MPTTSGYNLRPRIGKKEESRPTIERKIQQGGPVRSRKGREMNDCPYIEERTRSSNKNARRGGDQQRQDKERRGTCTKKSLSLKVLRELFRFCRRWEEEAAVTKPITPPITTDTRPCRQSCGNSSLFINSWKGISEHGPRRHKRRINNVFCLLPIRQLPVTTARLETHNVYPDIGARGA